MAFTYTQFFCSSYITAEPPHVCAQGFCSAAGTQSDRERKKIYKENWQETEGQLQ